jgi:hypothetical protein
MNKIIRLIVKPRHFVGASALNPCECPIAHALNEITESGDWIVHPTEAAWLPSGRLDTLMEECEECAEDYDVYLEDFDALLEAIPDAEIVDFDKPVTQFIHNYDCFFERVRFESPLHPYLLYFLPLDDDRKTIADHENQELTFCLEADGDLLFKPEFVTEE